MSKDSSAKYRQESNERLRKKHVKGIKIFLKKKKQKSKNKMATKIRVFQRLKSKG